MIFVARKFPRFAGISQDRMRSRKKSERELKHKYAISRVENYLSTATAKRTDHCPYLQRVFIYPQKSLKVRVDVYISAFFSMKDSQNIIFEFVFLLQKMSPSTTVSDKVKILNVIDKRLKKSDKKFWDSGKYWQQ